MKQGLNRTTIVGNVGADDAKLGQTAGGTPVANFSLAVNDSYKDKETTVWYKVAIFGKRGEALAPYIKSGTALFLAGRVSAGTPWESRDGWKADLVLTVGSGKEDFIFLGGGSREAEEGIAEAVDKALYTEE